MQPRDKSLLLTYVNVIQNTRLVSQPVRVYHTLL